ncbi:MAG: MFS transporter [Candidatus Hydrogenedentes bacterium]|nr:MFS transporter [Candidatus Hydrogenedentota bacterium]
MKPEVIKATAWAVLFTGLLAISIVIGSRNLSRFDAPLVAYTFATLFAMFGITYRYSMWLQRPPTAMFWKRGWQTFFSRGRIARNTGIWFVRVGGEFALNNFIWKRARVRWLAHFLIMWGSIIAAAITFPLVFGWMSFESLPGNIEWYRVYIFGFPTIAMPHESFLAFFIFHGLVWASLMVIPGVMIAMRRRMRDEGAAALQTFSEDFLPLILLFAVSVSGLLLTVSYTWLQGYGYEFLALLHAVTVIFTLLWLPFGKFFHIFQRPAQLGVEFYKDVAAAGEAATCGRCGHPFASLLHVNDLIKVEQALGYRYEIRGEPRVGHYQRICPPCRRAMLAIAQGSLMRGSAYEQTGMTLPMPAYVNTGLGEGPLGDEDARNFHP